ncbi:NADH-quinone oxidoreductase subunit NuoK [Paradesulfitobacterium ferrireducens]|uniref:NADH-quinone oxidoreductase subunit NuoK n=1 Tax=Paradesulfitobacterium ferrireducens TaxID=2816476 RepID=UPI001A8F930E|nr:NADH-quinone oxidoreductase subunit NuoK [Paradesulfitobacterium ferrireducens]
MSFSVGLSTYLLVGAMLFSLGLYGIFAKKNVIAVLMSIELMLNAVNLNFVAFNRFLGNESVLHGFVTAVFIIVLAAAEVAVGLALVISIYRTRKSTSVDDFNWLKW